MYDEVYLKCPHCGSSQKYQSVNGPCVSDLYNMDQVPVTVADELRDLSFFCNKCDNSFKLIIPPQPQFIKLKAIIC